MARPYPWYYAVNDRPVKIVELPDGGADALVFEAATGRFIPDRSYFGRVLETGIGKDIDQLTEAEFEALAPALRRSASEQRQASRIVWEATGDGEFPYRAEVGGHTFTIRVNDFPAEPLYTLLVGDHEVEDLEDWPSPWVRPAFSGRP